MSMDDKTAIDQGFSKISHDYEQLEAISSLIRWKRKRVRHHLLSRLAPNSSVLEINCGSGIDASFLAKNGYNVHATDIAGGMIAYVKNKIEQDNLTNLNCEVLPNTDLHNLKPKTFDCVFSNFGGLNFSSPGELQDVLSSLPELLSKNGEITLVIMPKICVWEFLRIFRGRKYAFRRLKKGGTLANIKSEKARTYYHSARQVKRMLSEHFTDFKVENICFLGPTGNHVHFPKKHPFLFKICVFLDKVSNSIPFFRGYGDYYILSARKNNHAIHKKHNQN